MCSRLQAHFNACATTVVEDQKEINFKIKEVDRALTEQYNKTIEKQKAYSSVAEAFSKIDQISETLNQCKRLLNENIESLEALNNILPEEHRLEPFVWEANEVQL